MYSVAITAVRTFYGQEVAAHKCLCICRLEVVAILHALKMTCTNVGLLANCQSRSVILLGWEACENAMSADGFFCGARKCPIFKALIRFQQMEKGHDSQLLGNNMQRKCSFPEMSWDELRLA